MRDDANQWVAKQELAACTDTRRYRHRQDDPEIKRAMALIDSLAAKFSHETTDSTAIIRRWRDTQR